jgi:hypothetical protein
VEGEKDSAPLRESESEEGGGGVRGRPAPVCVGLVGGAGRFLGMAAERFFFGAKKL